MSSLIKKCLAHATGPNIFCGSNGGPKFETQAQLKLERRASSEISFSCVYHSRTQHRLVCFYISPMHSQLTVFYFAIPSHAQTSFLFCDTHPLHKCFVFCYIPHMHNLFCTIQCIVLCCFEFVTPL